MALEKPTILIIGGAFHTPNSYQKLVKALELAGYEVHVPSLPTGNGARPPTANLTTDSQLIRGYAESLIRAGRRIVVIAHSYGGQVCSNALHGLGTKDRSGKGLSGGVAALIYMSSFALPEGMAAFDKSKEFGNMDLIPLAFDIDEDKTAVPRDPRVAFVDPSIDEEEAEAFLKTLVRWNLHALFQPIEQAAWREISPVVYIYTTEDMWVPIHYQQNIVECVEKEGVEVHTFELKTGHCPQISDPQGVVDIVTQNQVYGHNIHPSDLF
ncbi:hypothetical protein KJ359_002922 [Pestalotiopsis sp. 9143b]|nr:hypothetical protein KJ359_002922 [Pestalotiopsis sp. 9143b]